jgi:hypothetical protein
MHYKIIVTHGIIQNHVSHDVLNRIMTSSRMRRTNIVLWVADSDGEK